MTETPVVDRAALERLEEWGGERLLVQMVRLFIENSGERMRQIHDGFDGGTLAEVERGAHSLKSNAGNVGAVRVNRLAQAMEDAASGGDMERARELKEPLEEAMEQAVRELRDVERGFQHEA